MIKEKKDHLGFSILVLNEEIEEKGESIQGMWQKGIGRQKLQ